MLNVKDKAQSFYDLFSAFQTAILRVHWVGDDRAILIFTIFYSCALVWPPARSTYQNEKILFISYIATYNVKQKGDEIIQSFNIFDGLLDYFNNAKMAIDEILFETEELRTFRFFSRLVRNKYKKNTYRLKIDYIQPEILTDSDIGITNEIPSFLGYIPFCLKHEITSLSKTKVIELIKSIYYNIYRNITDLSKEEREMYLNTLLENYKSTIDDEVDLLQS